MARPANPNLRDALIEAGRAEFAEQGLEHARIEDVTRRAGASKGAFYLHFQSKEQLFEHIVRSFIDEVLAHLCRHTELACHRSEGAAVPGGVRPEDLAHAIEADLDTMQLLWDNRGTFKMLMEGSTPLHSRLRDALVGGLYDYFRATACQGPPGFDAQIDPDTFALFVTGALMMVAWRMVRDPVAPDFRQISWSMHRLMAGGLFPTEISVPLVAALDAIRPPLTPPRPSSSQESSP